MSRRPDDIALDALLADYAAPPVPADLAARVTAAALALPQAPATVAARAGRDRRGGWLRRPVIAGAAALGLAFSGAVAATYADLPLPPKVQAVIAHLPLVGSKREPPPPSPPPSRPKAPDRPAMSSASAVPPQTEERPFRAFWQSLSPYERRRLRQAPPAHRLFVAQRIVDTRRAAGLPTPSADRIEQAIERRRAMAAERNPIVQELRAERRAARRERIRAGIQARRDAMGPETPAEIIDGPVDLRMNLDPDAGTDARLDPTWEETVARARAERRERRRAIREERQRRLREMREEPPAERPVEVPQ